MTIVLSTGKLPKHNTFELDDVSTFAVDNSPANIWAAGKSGWYEIQPSKEYQAIYDHMMVGIDLFFTLEDFHTDEAQKTRRVPLTVDLLAREVGSTFIGRIASENMLTFSIVADG